MITLTLETSAPGRALSRLLSVFAKVEPHEGVSAVRRVIALMSYCLLETAREPLILLAIIRCWLWMVIGSSRERVSAC